VLGLIGGILALLATNLVADQVRAGAKGLASEVTVLVATAAGQVVVLALLWLALSYALRPVAVRWTALLPGALLFAAGFQRFSLAVAVYFAPRAARASTLYGSLGVALTLLVSLFLFARLAVAAAELDAALWERRHPGRRPEGRARPGRAGRCGWPPRATRRSACRRRRRSGRGSGRGRRRRLPGRGGRRPGRPVR
jgi:uncharacterized BrkB/YihY/UPF0761 family membrane protein